LSLTIHFITSTSVLKIVCKTWLLMVGHNRASIHSVLLSTKQMVCCSCSLYTRFSKEVP